MSEREKPPQETETDARFRARVAWSLGALALLYTFAVVTGLLEKDQQIDGVHLTLILLAALAILIVLRPRTLERLKLLELSGFKLEMLAKVRERQAEQGSQLDDIALMLPLLLPPTERKHLTNLDRGRTGSYKGNGALRAELRRLRSIGLIRMRGENTVGAMTTGTRFDLSERVALTPLGERWVRRIEEIEKDDVSAADEE